MAEAEEYFPRGGKKPTVTYFKQSGNFLSAAEKGEKKKKKPKKKSEDDDGYLSDDFTKTIDKSVKNCASRLSYKSIKAGVTILGRVHHVQETKLTLSLPGNMMGTVMACHISEAYNKQLEAYVDDKIEKIRELPEMYRPGQYVAAKVLEVEGTKLMLTMMPQHVNSVLAHTDLHKGDLLQAAVSSVEDHGYVMDIGVLNTRCFLPKAKANSEIELDLGMVTWCVVKSVTSEADSSVVALSNELGALQGASPRRKTPLLPGTPLHFVVDTPLENGIEGHVLGDTTAYIQRQHADKVKGKKPALGQKILARVLYVMPTRNTPFLTMKDIFETTYPDLNEEQKLKDGEMIEEAQVLRILGRSVHFKLGQRCVGTMSIKHIQVDEDLADEDVVAKSYPIGSKHRVRVLSYAPSDYTYVVSDRSDLLSERYFTLSQLNTGDLVEAVVRTVGDNHLLVNVGRLTGYIPQTHYSDAGVFVDPKKASTPKLSKKFKVGNSLQARVLAVDRPRNGLLLTLKPSLLNPELEVLSTYEQAQVGKAYTGFIRLVREYLLVSFFDNVTALVPRNYVTKEPLDNLHDAFHLGQIVNCTILRVDPENKKMSGSLTTTPFWPAPKRETTGKRKQNVDTDEVPNKKVKKTEEESNKKEKKKKRKDSEHSEEDVEVKSKKKKDKKRKDSEQENEDADEDQQKSKKNKKAKSKLENADADVDDAVTDSKKNKKKKKTSISEEEVKVSEESDAIETDIHEDTDDVLTPQDQYLVDLTDCEDMNKCKRRILSLTRNVNARLRRIDKIDMKIANIEQKGLNARNKKFHTAMHMEKLVIQKRVEKLLEATKQAQQKLIGLGYVDDGSHKKKKEKKEKRKRNDSKTKESVKEEVKERSKVPKKKKKEVVVENLEPVLEIPSAKDFWSTNTESTANNVQEDSSSSDEEEQEQPKKKRKKLSVAEKLSKVRAEEARVRALETAAAAGDAPRSSGHFERALLAEPDSSQLWIAYMAFHLQATEIDRARAVARRALSTVSFRAETDKLNVWLALLNLEHRYGTKDTQQKVLEEALQMNEPYDVHSKLLDIYVDMGKQQETSSLVDLMLRKHRRRADVYTRCGAACYSLGLTEKARQAMQKAITVLEKKEHVSVLVQFAQLEANSGSRERAGALLEQVLAAYPRRVDVCALYADMLFKHHDYDALRQLMERMTSLKLPARKMKILYKKWIEIEERIGDQERVDQVREKAMQFIEEAKF